MTRTIVSHGGADAFSPGLRPYFSYRDLGMRDATGGGFGAHVIRAVPGVESDKGWHTHDLAFQMVYVLRGWVEFEYADIGRVRLEADSSAYQPPGIRHREVAHSDDLEMLEITAPAAFETHMEASGAID